MTPLRSDRSFLAAHHPQVRILSAGERAKFESGESTLFLVNARERQVLDEEMKQIALQAKRLAARAALAVAAGAPGRLPELR